MVPNLEHELNMYFNANKHRFNFALQTDCGRFTEEFLLIAREHDEKFYHLRKYGTQTQYNKHAIDVIAYDNRGQNDGTPVMEVDILGKAESANAHPTWQVRTTAYDPEKDLMHPDELEEPQPDGNTVLWVPYFGDASNAELKRILSFDYSRRPQGADWDISVWAFRVMYTALMGLKSPSDGGFPLGLSKAVEHHRPEWCASLGVPVIPVPPDWVIP